MILKLFYLIGSKFKYIMYNFLIVFDDDYLLYIDIFKNIKEIFKFESLNS